MIQRRQITYNSFIQRGTHEGRLGLLVMPHREGVSLRCHWANPRMLKLTRV